MYRVLVADDEPLALKSVCSIIERRSRDYKVVATAENGQEALQKIRQIMPELVICDIKMPLLTGVELASIVREEFPKISFIIVSGYQDFEYAQSAIRSGVADYILKPVVPSVLLKSLEHAGARIREIQYAERNRILRTLGNGESVDMAVVKRYMPCGSYYGALLRVNGLPRRFSMDKTRQIYSEIQEQYVVFGRDEMESLYLIPGELLPRNMFLKYLEKIEGKQNQNDYYTLIYDSKSFPVEELQEKIRELYKKLDQCSSVGVTQKLNLAELPEAPESASARRLLKIEEGSLSSLESVVRTGKQEQIESEIRKTYETLGQYHPPQLWLENFTREVLSIMRQHGLCRLSMSESEHFLSDAFFCATSVQMLTDSLMDVFLSCEKDRIRSSKVDSQEYFDSVDRFLRMNLGKAITLMDLCRQFGISQTYMSRLFRKYSGNSFSQHLTELRMNRAKELFCEKPDSFIKDIAVMVGYEDQFYFSRIFRSYMGKSPSEYLKEVADIREKGDHCGME